MTENRKQLDLEHEGVLQPLLQSDAMQNMIASDEGKVYSEVETNFLKHKMEYEVNIDELKKIFDRVMRFMKDKEDADEKVFNEFKNGYSDLIQILRCRSSLQMCTKTIQKGRKISMFLKLRSKDYFNLILKIIQEQVTVLDSMIEQTTKFENIVHNLLQRAKNEYEKEKASQDGRFAADLTLFETGHVYDYFDPISMPTLIYYYDFQFDTFWQDEFCNRKVKSWYLIQHLLTHYFLSRSMLPHLEEVMKSVKEQQRTLKNLQPIIK